MVDVCTGPLTFADLKRLTMIEKSHPDFLEVDRILSDISEADLIVNANDIEEFASLLSTPGTDSTARWAILTAAPNHVALSMLLKTNLDQFQAVEVFSTLNACNTFLEIKYRDEQFDEEGFVEV